MSSRRLVLATLLSVAATVSSPGCSGQELKRWRDLPHLPDGYVEALWSTWDGTLLAGIDEAGLFYLDASSDTWARVSLGGVGSPEDVRGFHTTAFDAEQRLVFVASTTVGSQLFRLETSGSGLHAEPVGDLLPLATELHGSMAFTDDGTLVAAGAETLARLAPGTAAWVTEPLPVEHQWSAVARAGDGNLYIGGATKGLHRLVVGDPVTFEPAYDCDTAEFTFCSDLFNGTIVDGDGHLVESTGAGVRRFRVDTAKLETLCPQVDEWRVQEIFPSNGHDLYLLTGFNAEDRRVYRLRGGDAALLAAGVYFDRQAFATRDGTVYELSPRPTYLFNEIRRLE